MGVAWGAQGKALGQGGQAAAMSGLGRALGTHLGRVDTRFAGKQFEHPVMATWPF